MDYVVHYVLAFRDVQQSSFHIDPLDLRFYIEGQMETKDMARKMTITSL
jgi:hypothetical protein